MACDQERMELENAVFSRAATVQALIAADAAASLASMAKNVADMNRAVALANDAAAAALVTAKQAAYDQCLLGQQQPEPPEAELMPSAQRKRKRPAAKKKPKEPKPPTGGEP